METRIRTLAIAASATLMLALGAGASTASASATKCAYKLWDIAGLPYPVPIGQVCVSVFGAGLNANTMRVSWDPLGPGRRICNARAIITVNPPVGAGATSVGHSGISWGCRYIPINFDFGAASYFPGYGYLPKAFPNNSVVHGRIEETSDNGRTWRTYQTAGAITISR